MKKMFSDLTGCLSLLWLRNSTKWFLTPVVVLFLLNSVATAQPSVIKFAVIAPKEATNLFEAVKETARKTPDAKIKVYYGAVQGDESDVLRKIGVGQLQGGWFTGHGLSKIVSEVQLLELPWLYRSHEEAEYIIGRMQSRLNPLFEKKGWAVLGWHEVGLIYIFSKEPVVTLADARRQRWWMWEDNIMHKHIYSAMKLNAVPLCITDVLTSLSTNLVDVSPITPLGAISYRWYLRFNYMNEHPIANSVSAIIVRKNIWETLSEESRRAIYDTFQAGLVEESRLRKVQNADCIEALQAHGVQMIRAEDQKEFLALQPFSWVHTTYCGCTVHEKNA